MEEKIKDYNKKEESPQTEQEMLFAQIEASAEHISVPKSLQPEAVKEQLRSKKNRVSLRRITEIAAAVALVVVVGGTGIYGMINQNAEETGSSNGTMEAVETTGNSMDAGAGVREPAEEKKKTAVVGEYHLAADYREVYKAVENYADRRENSTNGTNDVIMEDTFYSTSDSTADLGAAEEESAGEALSEKEYSTTNLQVEGVDESDFIKNDGNYLYVQTGEQIRIIDITGEEMKEVAVITPELEETDAICDMYVDQDRLYLIVQKREVDLQESGTSEDTEEMLWSSTDASCIDIAYEIDKNRYVELFTYDISDRQDSKLLGTITQDGSYYDSRKVGDYVYLFSQKYPEYSSGVTNYIFDERSVVETDDVIPKINGEKASADCIYLQEEAGNQLIFSSVNTQEPEKVVDYLVLMNNYAQIYMSTEAIYLYSCDYDWEDGNGKSYTDIAKFSYKDGVLNGVGAASLQGTIGDVFAISEANGILRVLTTEWMTNASTNQLYLLDDSMEQLGSLKGIAEGEEIYAARYIGDVAYFITYHNTDPLFAVDISDPSDPKMLGQLEITGFSDYLHPYGEGLLLGIGYETDPDTSERLGVKLVMFDISNPTELKVLDTVTLDGNYCSAANYYKSALVSESKNLIGFEVSDWSKENRMKYYLYSWEDGKFVCQFRENIDADRCWDESTIRGLYAGERFYLVNQKDNGYEIRSYDMGEEYKKLDELEIP